MVEAALKELPTSGPSWIPAPVVRAHPHGEKVLIKNPAGAAIFRGFWVGSKSYPARGDGSAGRLGRPGKFVMHGVQGHGSAVNGRGPKLRKPPALIHLSNLRCLAKNAQNGIVFGSV